MFAIFLAYLVIGAAFLLVLDLLSGRIRRKLDSATRETQYQIATVNNAPTGRKTALVVILLATWLLWPVVLAGWITDKGDKNV